MGPNGALQVIKIAHARNGALPPLNTEVEPSKGQVGLFYKSYLLTLSC